VAHICNPGYLGGRDEEDCGSRPAWANSSGRSYPEKPFTKIGLVEWLKMKALSSSPSTTKKKKILGIPSFSSFFVICVSVYVCMCRSLAFFGWAEGPVLRLVKPDPLVYYHLFLPT
jgi:uncharacterized membrane protein YoaT (DUF817 family)